MSIKTKINDLRKTAAGLLSQEDEVAIDQLEKSVKHHDLYNKWKSHPITSEIKQKISSYAISMNSRLSTDRKLQTEERLAIMSARDFILYFLSLIDENHDISSLEKEVEEKIKNFEHYKNNYSR